VQLGSVVVGIDNYLGSIDIDERSQQHDNHNYAHHNDQEDGNHDFYHLYQSCKD
jgi:hypothetical protein